MTSRLYVATRDNVIQDEVVAGRVMDGGVSLSLNDAIKMQFRASATPPDIATPYSQYLAPFLRLEQPDGSSTDSQLGLFAFEPPSVRHHRSISTGAIQGADLTWLLSLDGFGTTYTVVSGTNYVTAALAILTGAGFTRVAIPSTTKTIPTAMTFGSEKTKLQIVNDLLEGCGYYHLWVDRTGRLMSGPYIDWDVMEPALYVGAGGVSVTDYVEDEPVMDRLTNKVTVVRENTALPPLDWTETNNNPASPVSTVRLGVTIRKRHADQHIADLATAQETARHMLQLGASYYRRVRFSTGPDPSRNPREVYQLDVRRDDGTPLVVGRFLCSGWALGFRPGSAKMSHNVAKTEPYLGVA